MSSWIGDADAEDALREVMNLGVGAAGAALAETLGAFVQLTVPTVMQIESQSVVTELAAAPWNDRPVRALRQRFYGALDGDALVIFDDNGAHDLADLLGHTAGDSRPSAPTDEVVLELGNLMVGACVNAVADRLNQVISFAPPSMMCSGTPLSTALTPAALAGRRMLMVRIELTLEARQFQSRIGLLFSEAALQHLQTAIQALLAELAN